MRAKPNQGTHQHELLHGTMMLETGKVKELFANLRANPTVPSKSLPWHLPPCGQGGFAGGGIHRFGSRGQGSEAMCHRGLPRLRFAQEAGPDVEARVFKLEGRHHVGSLRAHILARPPAARRPAALRPLAAPASGGRTSCTQAAAGPAAAGGPGVVACAAGPVTAGIPGLLPKTRGVTAASPVVVLRHVALVLEGAGGALEHVT
mmetsp:Transcript_44552/g.119170  ORF Transcript_44552/g.119170 Transcript_44552/m.119170 type:complete len:204 (+) Transcript_44552:16-627(+)